MLVLLASDTTKLGRL